MGFPAQPRLSVNIPGLFCCLGLCSSFLFLVVPFLHLLLYQCILGSIHTQGKQADSREAEEKMPVYTIQTHLQSPLYLPQILEHLSLLSLCTTLLRMAVTSARQGDSEVMERLDPQAGEGWSGWWTKSHECHLVV